MSRILPLLSLAALAAAQSSTVNLFLPYADPQSLVASIAGSDPAATQYVVNCPSAASTTAAPSAAASGDDFGDIGDNDCGFPTGVTVTQGPSTVKYVISALGNVESVDCKLAGTTQAVCTLSASGALFLSNSLPPLTTGTLSGSDVQFLPVVVTAGSATAKPSGTGSAGAKVTGGSSATGSGSTAKTTGSAAAGGQSQTSSSATAKGTNAATQQGASIFGAGVIGALGVAVAGAML